MITLLCGENDFELTRYIAGIKTTFGPNAERYEATELTIEHLADIFAGQTLFSLQRLVIIDTPSANNDLWTALGTWSKRLSEETQLLLVESKPDKRTAGYKWLKTHAAIKQFDPIDDRNDYALGQWLEAYAHTHNVSLTRQQARQLLLGSGNDQWALAQAVDKLALLEEVTDDWINDVVQTSPNESVFALLETSLNGDQRRLQPMIATLRLTQDPYGLFGLMSSQMLQVVALVYGEGNVQRVATDTAAKSAYPLQKLAPAAARLSKRQATTILGYMAEGDLQLKSSDAGPWTVLESTLAKVASLQATA